VAQTLEALRRGSLAGVRELTLREGLTEFPREILDLADTLEVLDLSGNALSALPHDFGRLKHLKVLFCSGNRFEVLPESLGDCAALSQVGFRGCGLGEIPADALPPAVRWLTLTDNAISTVPKALGERPALQKLMLAGNRLVSLPGSLADLARLELVRLSANRFETLPGWLVGLPRLAWAAFAGNPFDTAVAPLVTPAPWSQLEVGPMLGEGASGQVHQALWSPPGATPREVALKLFKGAMTSDGLPEREMAACLAAGAHPNLTGALGRLTGHPNDADGLLMALLPPDWRILAGPPSRETCSRDVYDPALRLPVEVALRIAREVGAAAAHLHGRGLTHGDLYAHNVLWDGKTGAAVLSDFGAAAFMPADLASGLKRLEVLAWGLLLGELLDLTDAPPAAARAVQAACTAPEVMTRPRMVEALDALH
jgi:hypothetical protein